LTRGTKLIIRQFKEDLRKDLQEILRNVGKHTTTERIYSNVLFFRRLYIKPPLQIVPKQAASTPAVPTNGPICRG
jgi:hypothetical protein